MPRHPDTVITANALLRAARLRQPSPSRAGQCLSRGELADAINAALERLFPAKNLASQYVDFRWIGKLERGEHRWTSHERRAALRNVFGARKDAELGLYSPRHTYALRVDSAQRPAAEQGLLDEARSQYVASVADCAYPRRCGRSAAAAKPSAQGVGIGVAVSEGAISSRAVSDEGALIIQIGHESARHGNRAGHSNVADGQLDALEAAIGRLCLDMIDGPLIPLVRELRQIRDEAFTALEGRQYPRQGRRLYAVGARACGLLAATMADRFGVQDVASIHARTASIAADFSEDSALIAWTASLHSTIAFWQGRYRSAATIARRARHDDLVGVEAARLAGLEARAWARFGDRDAMHAALAAAETAREEDGPQAGVGVLAYPYANQARMTATALLWIGDYATARTQLAQAIELLLDAYASPAHLAAARMDLADAFLHTGALDDAAATVHPLMGQTGSYLAGAARRGVTLVDRLRVLYPASSVAHQLIDDIEAFLAAQATNGESGRVGAAFDRGLPQ